MVGNFTAPPSLHLKNISCPPRKKSLINFVWWWSKRLDNQMQCVSFETMTIKAIMGIANELRLLPVWGNSIMCENSWLWELYFATLQKYVYVLKYLWVKGLDVCSFQIVQHHNVLMKREFSKSPWKVARSSFPELLEEAPSSMMGFH